VTRLDEIHNLAKKGYGSRSKGERKEDEDVAEED
jgi:hypothetical protein